jgi:hypothetical protein
MKALATTAALAVVTLNAPAYAGHGNSVGAGLLGFGGGAIVGSALTPQTVYVPLRRRRLLRPTTALQPMAHRHGVHAGTAIAGTSSPYFNARTGYFQGDDGGWYFCR